MTSTPGEAGAPSARGKKPLLFGVAPITSVQLDSQLVQRYSVDAGRMRKVPATREQPTLLFVFVLAGVIDVVFTQVPARRWQSQEHRGFYVRSSDDCVVSWCDGTDAVLVATREDVLSEFGATLEDDGLPLFADASALVAPAIGFFTGLLSNADLPNRIAAYAMSRLTEEILGGLLLERNSIGAGAVRAQPSLYRRALALMATRRAEPTLTTSSLAIELAVSRRHLQRAFQEQGSSPSVELRRLRVELAVQLLTQPRYRVLSVTQVAGYAGFTTVDDLRRAFRLEKMPAPSRVRASVRD